MSNSSHFKLHKIVFLAFFLGIFGLHRFYLGKYKSGLLQLITGGGFLIWLIFDLIALGQEKFTDNQNKYLKWPYHNGDRAGFTIRMLAYCLDLFIIYLVINFIFFAFIPESLIENEQVFFINLGILKCFIILSYFVLFSYFYGATPGKILFNLEIIRSDEGQISLIQAIVRYLGYFISHILMVGFMMIAARKDKMALHDFIACTKVIYKKSY